MSDPDPLEGREVREIHTKRTRLTSIGCGAILIAIALSIWLTGWIAG